MSTHNIVVYGEITKLSLNYKISSNTHLISSSAFSHGQAQSLLHAYHPNLLFLHRQISIFAVHCLCSIISMVSKSEIQASCHSWFVSCLVGNPKDRLDHIIILKGILFVLKKLTNFLEALNNFSQTNEDGECLTFCLYAL